jgi:hypothetical protein
MPGRLSETVKSIQILEAKNYTGAAGADVYVSLKRYPRVRFTISTGAWAGGTAAVTLLQATAVAGTNAKALALTTYYDDKTTTGTLARKTATSNTFNLDAANKQYVIDVDARQLDVANGFNCVAVHIASPGTNADLYAVQADLYGGRFEGVGAMPSALVD